MNRDFQVPDDWSQVSARPPARLRAKVLAGARAARRGMAPVPVQTIAYAGQVTAMDGLLAGLAPADWRARVPGDRDVGALITHLSANDALVAAEVGSAAPNGTWPRGRPPREVWREGATALLDRVRPRTDMWLEQPVPMAGRRPATRPLRDGLIQRAFETWIHADDIRAAVGWPPNPPPPEHLRLIADLGARLLPVVLGPIRPGKLARLVLGGPGGGVWDVPLDTGPVAGDPATVITVDAGEFCRLLACRRTPENLGYGVEGDAALARMILRAAATMGCE